MKKISVIIILALFISVLGSCSPDQASTTEAPDTAATGSHDGNINFPNASPVLSGSAESIIEYIYGKVPADGAVSVFIPGLEMKTAATDDDKIYFMGTSDVPYSDLAASEGMIQPTVYSLVIVKLDDDCDFEAMRSRIEQNINTSKWVCMGASNSGVIRINGVVCITMGTAEVCGELEEAFMSLSGK